MSDENKEWATSKDYTVDMFVATPVSLISLIGLAVGEVSAVEHFKLEEYFSSLTAEGNIATIVAFVATITAAVGLGSAVGNRISPGFAKRISNTPVLYD